MPSKPNAMDRPPVSYTPEEYIELAGDLKDLTSHPAWATYARLVRDVINGSREQGFEQRERIDWWAGVVAGLKMAYEVPADVIRETERILRQDEAEEKRAASKRRRARLGDEELSGI